jgi:hypothetical protein
MSKTNARQLFQLQAVLFNNAKEIEELDSGCVQAIIDRPEFAGRNFMKFLRNGARAIVGGPMIIKIDRNTPFNVEEYPGNSGWSIVEQDQRSLSITEIDLMKVDSVPIPGFRAAVDGPTALAQLKKRGIVRWDAGIGQALMNEKDQHSLEWLLNEKGIGVIPLYGTVVSKGKSNCFLALERAYEDEEENRKDQWEWRYCWFDHRTNVNVLVMK